MNKKFTYGWFLVGYCALLFMLGAGITVDGLNVIVPGFSDLRNWDYNLLLSFSSIGGIIGFLGTIFFAQLVVKKGVRYMTVIALILSGIDTIVYSRSNSIPMYIITLCILFFTVNGYSFIAPTTIITNWFPTKKGIAFGIATMGLPLATALFVPLLAILFSRIGVENGLTAVGIFITILGILSIFIIKNTPEEIGLSPDGIQMSEEEIKKQKDMIDSYVTKWKIGQLLKNKAVWMISIGYGFIFLVTVGIISQLVPRVMSLGYDQTTALFMLSLCATVGILGSFVWGWLDQKLSTKKASIILASWYIVALVLLIISASNLPMLIFAIVMVGFGVGGIGNLQPSMVVQVFGRFEYASVNRIITPLISVIRILAFAVVGIALTVTGNYEGAYSILLVINIIALTIIYFITDNNMESEKMKEPSLKAFENL